MPINHIVQFCDNDPIRQYRCVDCPNETCLNSCVNCLERIHNNATKDRYYSCGNIANCYVCNYIYKISSEIEYLLNLNVEHFRIDERFVICSIGCGPCCELFGLTNFKTRNNLGFTIEYNGFDINDVWRNIHTEIDRMFTFPTNFVYGDVFEYYENQEIVRPNLIILNYVLSDILRDSREEFDNFIDKLCILVSRLDNCILIINDINLGRNDSEVRHHFGPLMLRLREENNITKTNCYHFAYNGNNYWRYGKQHASNIATVNPPRNIIERYGSWIECRSAQVIIFKNVDI